MKKTLLAILLGVSILALGGCGSKETAGKTSTGVGQELVKETVEVVEEATGTEEQAEDVEEQEEVVEEETLGVPDGTIPDYAKDWQEGDDIWYDPNSTENSELAGLTSVQENHWTSGVVTINGEAIKLGTTLGELEAAGYDLSDVVEGKDVNSCKYAQGDVLVNDTLVVFYFESDSKGLIENLPLVQINVKSEDALGAELCGITVGDDFGKYTSNISDKFYERHFHDGYTDYTYVSEDNQYEVLVQCDPYNVMEIAVGIND